MMHWGLLMVVVLFLVQGEWMDDFTVEMINGRSVRLSEFQAKALLIVNVASECGYTDSNYKQLQARSEESVHCVILNLQIGIV